MQRHCLSGTLGALMLSKLYLKKCTYPQDCEGSRRQDDSNKYVIKKTKHAAYNRQSTDPTGDMERLAAKAVEFGVITFLIHGVPEQAVKNAQRAVTALLSSARPRHEVSID